MFSQQCLDLIKRWEGFLPKAYPDPQSGNEPWTIGFGFTSINGVKVKPGDTITREEAERVLAHEVYPHNLWIRRNVKVPLTQGQEDALTCFVFNLGGPKVASSTALRRLNQGDYDGAAKAMMWWVSPGTRVERGLRNRRQAEVDLFHS